MSRKGWEPTTEIEVALYDALLATDQERYFRALGRSELLLPVSADAVAGRSPMGWATWTSNDHTHLLAFTSLESMRTCLAEHAGAARRMPFAELAAAWPNQDWWLAVNPGLPIEGYLPAWFVAQLGKGDARLPGLAGSGSGPRDRLARVEALERAKAARAAGAGGGQRPRESREPVRVSATVAPRALPSSPTPPEALPVIEGTQPSSTPWLEPASQPAYSQPGYSQSAHSQAGNSQAGHSTWSEPASQPGYSAWPEPAATPASPLPAWAGPTPLPPQNNSHSSTSQSSRSARSEAASSSSGGGRSARSDAGAPPISVPAPAIPPPAVPAAAVPPAAVPPATVPTAVFPPAHVPSGFTPAGAPAQGAGEPLPRRIAPEPTAATLSNSAVAPAAAVPPAAVPPPAVRPAAGSSVAGSGAAGSGAAGSGVAGSGVAGSGVAGSGGAATQAAPWSEPAHQPSPINGRARHSEPEPEFVPANAVEEQLYEAAEAGNTDAFLSTLLLATVLIPKSTGTTNGKWRPQPIDGEPHLICYTSTQHLAEHLETVSIKFIKLISDWPDPTWSFAVNPGTPVGATLPGGQLLALANWAAEVGLGGDDEEQGEQTSSEHGAPTAAGRASTELTVLQKAIAPSQVSYYLERGYDRVSGFVQRAHEVGHLRSPDQMRKALGLNWEGSPFAAEATEIYLLRWSAYRPNLYRIPYGGQHEAGMRAMEGWVIERAPFRGNGFAPGESTEIIAEFKVDSARLPHGARLMRLQADGTETIVAILDADGQRWLRTDGGGS